MLNLSKQNIKIKCPACLHSFSVLVSLIKNNETITCGKCLQKIYTKEIKLSISQAISKVNKRFFELEQSLKMLDGSIEINNN